MTPQILAAQHEKAAPILKLQQQSNLSHQEQVDRLNAQVEAHLRSMQSAERTFELIDIIITRYPNAPRFASVMVDRLMAGNESLAAALREEV